MSPSRDHYWIQQATTLAVNSVNQEGGPFGAVIIKNDQLIGSGNNQVTRNNDPTAHAEIMAIRAACTHLQNFSLDGCTLYTSCEPCPMCLAAIYWARISRVVFAASGDDARRAGFDDTYIAHELCLPHTLKSVAVEHYTLENSNQCFQLWQKKADRTNY